jgi:hypothetical protein
MKLLDSDAAMRVGLRQQLDDLATERQRVLAHLAYIERTIRETLQRLVAMDGRR